MMYFDYTSTTGTILKYTDRNGQSQTYEAYFIKPDSLIHTVAAIVSQNGIDKIQCSGLAWDLREAIRQELTRTYNYTNCEFIKGE